MSKYWIIFLSFTLFASCKVNEIPISQELFLLKNDILTHEQIDSILNKNEIPKSDWDIHKTDSINGVYIPYNLYDCFIQLDFLFSDTLKSEMIATSGEELSGQYHFGFGMWMRNNWGLWKNSRLWLYFYHKGVSHPDDISSLILKMYHRKITNTELSLQKDLESIKESMAETKKLNRKERDREIAISSHINIGDSINFQMPIDLESRNVFLYAYPSLNLELKDKFRDSMLIISGIVTDKSYAESDSVADFRIRIQRLSQLEIKILSNIKNIGDELELEAKDLYLLD